MMKNFSVAALVIIKVVFDLLEDHNYITSGHVLQQLAKVGKADPGNIVRTLDKFSQVGWLEKVPIDYRETQNPRAGRIGAPPLFMYQATETGQERYQEVKKWLSSFGIKL